ncbi:MAG: HD domain-containing protein [Chloroflexi bacterium]|nr:HD domain-containing protein [Chloroflexota bacterium]
MENQTLKLTGNVPASLDNQSRGGSGAVTPQPRIEIDSGRVAPITLDEVKRYRDFTTLLRKADEHLGIIGYTEHGLRHAGLVSSIAQNILLHLRYPERQAQLAAIAGYLHDIGNVINRNVHGETGAILVLQLLLQLGMSVDEAAVVAAAVGNHEKQTGVAVSDVAAAVIIADKSDVHRSRVRNPNPAEFDIHDRVNFSAVHSFVRVDDVKHSIALELTIDEEAGAGVMDYFEIFLQRMLACRRAAKFLGCQFELVINKNRMI